jgi:hypothetical protein
VVLGGCRSVSTFTFVGQLDVIVGFMLCGCASVLVRTAGLYCMVLTYVRWVIKTEYKLMSVRLSAANTENPPLHVILSQFNRIDITIGVRSCKVFHYTYSIYNPCKFHIFYYQSCVIYTPCNVLVFLCSLSLLGYWFIDSFKHLLRIPLRALVDEMSRYELAPCLGTKHFNRPRR